MIIIEICIQRPGGGTWLLFINTEFIHRTNEVMQWHENSDKDIPVTDASKSESRFHMDSDMYIFQQDWQVFPPVGCLMEFSFTDPYLTA